MKYMLMMFGDGATMMHMRTADQVAELITGMQSFNADTAHAGELIEARGLADPSKAKTVSLIHGQVVIADGPYAEIEESLAGFWVLNVDSEHRALELAARAVEWAERVELREIPDEG